MQKRQHAVNPSAVNELVHPKQPSHQHPRCPLQPNLQQIQATKRHSQQQRSSLPMSHLCNLVVLGVLLAYNHVRQYNQSLPLHPVG